MALTTTRTVLRRVLTLSSSSSLHRLSTTTTNNNILLERKLGHGPPPPARQIEEMRRYIHSTGSSLVQSRSFNDVDKIDPDTILFEGCDYKHWLIVMDFGKDPDKRPPPQQMVDTYVQTLATVLGSVEEAKKKIYACSTTTYTGFQAEIDEETSKKLEELPGVIFVLPDSYIDPVNKEYGGDKYINGTIIPRPPPVQYGRINRNRQNDQRSRGPIGQGNPGYNQHGSMSGEGRGYMPQRQNFSGNYGPTGEEGRANPMSNRTNNSNEGRDHYQSGGNTLPPSQHGNYNHGLPSHQGNYNQGMPSYQGNYNHGMPTHPGNYNQGYTHSQGQMSNFPHNQGGYTPQGQAEYPGGGRNYVPVPPARGADRQTEFGSFEQSGPGRYGQGPSSVYGEGVSGGYGSGNTSQVGDRRFSQAPDQYNTVSTEHGNYSPAGQTGMDQRRF